MCAYDNQAHVEAEVFYKAMDLVIGMLTTRFEYLLQQKSHVKLISKETAGTFFSSQKCEHLKNHSANRVIVAHQIFTP